MSEVDGSDLKNKLANSHPESVFGNLIPGFFRTWSSSCTKLSVVILSSLS